MSAEIIGIAMVGSPLSSHASLASLIATEFISSTFYKIVQETNIIKAIKRKEEK